MPEELVTLWRYRDLPEALIARAKLDSDAVWCVLADDNVVRLDWFWSNAMGGVKLQVEDIDAEYALALLAEAIPAEFTAEETGEAYRQPECPNCHSRDVHIRAHAYGSGAPAVGYGHSLRGTPRASGASRGAWAHSQRSMEVRGLPS